MLEGRERLLSPDLMRLVGGVRVSVSEMMAADVSAARAKRGRFASRDRTDQLARITPRPKVVGAPVGEVHQPSRDRAAHPHLTAVAVIGKELAMAGQLRAGRGVEERGGNGLMLRPASANRIHRTRSPGGLLA